MLAVAGVAVLYMLILSAASVLQRHGLSACDYAVGGVLQDEFWAKETAAAAANGGPAASFSESGDYWTADVNGCYGRVKADGHWQGHLTLEDGTRWHYDNPSRHPICETEPHTFVAHTAALRPRQLLTATVLSAAATLPPSASAQT